MPAPSSYTEATLAELALIELGATADVLGWTVGSPQVQAAVYATERLLGVSDVSTITDMVALELLARLSIWRAARAGLANLHRFSTDGQSFDTPQVFDHATAMVAEYERQAAAIGAGGIGVITVHEISRNDPYSLAVTSDGLW